jgi:hypothetical protein
MVFACSRIPKKYPIRVVESKFVPQSGWWDQVPQLGLVATGASVRLVRTGALLVGLVETGISVGFLVETGASDRRIGGNRRRSHVRGNWCLS